MAASSRIPLDDGPLQIYLTISELDRVRPPERRLSAPTVRLLAARYSQFGRWYLIFSEFPQLSEESITRFINVADAVDGIPHLSLRGNTLGAFQANIGLWQILARQREIPQAKLNSSWQKTIEPFSKITSSNQLFDAAHSRWERCTSPRPESEAVLRRNHRSARRSAAKDSGRSANHVELAAKIRSVLDDQHLVSLDTLFSLSDGLKQMERGATVGEKSGAARRRSPGFEMPRRSLPKTKRSTGRPPVYNSRHAELQVKTDLTKTIKASGSPAQLKAARGQLAPFVRDTLVGIELRLLRTAGRPDSP